MYWQIGGIELHMQYESSSDKISGSPMQMSPTTSNQGYKQNGDIRRTRRIVLVLLAINLVWTSCLFFSHVVERWKSSVSLGLHIFLFHRTYRCARSVLWCTSRSARQESLWINGCQCHCWYVLWVTNCLSFNQVRLAAISVLYVILFLLVVIKYIRLGILIVRISVDCSVVVHLAFR